MRTAAEYRGAYPLRRQPALTGAPQSADGVLTELEQGISLLDVAATTVDRRHAQAVALAGLRSADRFLSRAHPHGTNLDSILKRREELAQRLHAFTAVGDSNRGPAI
jgi:hypothetical protein